MTHRSRPIVAVLAVLASVVVIVRLSGVWDHLPGLAVGPPSAAPSADPRATGSTAASAPSGAAPSDPSAWTMVIDDQFGADLPSHWGVYNGPYDSGAHNCAIPSHDTVRDGHLDMLFGYEPSGICGPGWYSGGLALSGYSSVDARVSVRFRVVRSEGIVAHRIIPMRWPDDEATWPQAGEEDYCESATLIDCSTVLHHGTSNLQESHDIAIDLTQWHTIAVERRGYTVSLSVDGTLAWTYVGSEATLPSTLKHVVLQQECQLSCPIGTTGSEHILVDFVTVEVPH